MNALPDDILKGIFLNLNAHDLKSAAQVSKRFNRLASEILRTVPPVARGYEEIYQRFLKGVLIYRPNEGSDDGMIKLPIAQLANPLEGTFDLSQCGDTGKYLNISTGYPKEKKAENANKVAIWLAPRFLIEQELKTTARHFQEIMSKWGDSAPVGIFWTWGNWDTSQCYDYHVTENFDELFNDNLYKKWHAMAPRLRINRYEPPSYYCDTSPCQKFYVHFVN